ncbi:hypothetical protein, partial [Streptomyces virginiae]|uniref:hypothetical protein n=1 Tax=Streptomyces virginiae TaxID=1961 RepID=UPI002DB93403
PQIATRSCETAPASPLGWAKAAPDRYTLLDHASAIRPGLALGRPETFPPMDGVRPLRGEEKRQMTAEAMPIHVWANARPKDPPKRTN